MKAGIFLSKHRATILLCIIFAAHLFLRFYQIEQRNPFSWDQVDNAWAAKDILVDHKLPLVGMVAKQNTGFYIGPLYYYFIAPFYWFYNLDPAASGVIAGVTSIFTFFTLFFIIKKLFSEEVALLAVFIHTISLYVILADRYQWPINFMAPVSLLIFYALYKVLIGEEKYIFLLAAMIGISLHVNFTAIFFPIIIFFTLPFFPRSKKMFQSVLLAFPLFLLFLVPNIISELTTKQAQTKHVSDYISSSYHGFHVTRLFQIAHDAFIEFEGILTFKLFRFFEFFVPLTFFFVYLRKHNRNKKVLCYLIALWILIPWIIFTTYNGEISNYYFSLTRPIVLMTVSYLLIELFKIKNVVPKILVVLFLTSFTIANMNPFFTTNYHGLDYKRINVDNSMKEGKTIQFAPGFAEAYIYYVILRNQRTKK